MYALSLTYRIAGNFRLEKFFAFFAQARRGRKFFRRILLPSEKFVTLKFLHVRVFTLGCQAELIVLHDHQSAVLPGIQSLFFLDLQPSLMSLLSYFHTAPQVLPNPAGPLSSELSPSTIAEANAAVNGVQQANAKETTVQYLGVACSFESSTHYFLVSNSCCERN